MSLFKSESTNEKIARLHKEGVGANKIADEVSLPVDVVENVIRRKFPEEIKKQSVPSIQFVESGVSGFSKATDGEAVTVADIAKDFAQRDVNANEEKNVLTEEENKPVGHEQTGIISEESAEEENTKSVGSVTEVIDLRGETVNIEQSVNVEEQVATAVVAEARDSALTKMQKFASSEKMKAEQVVAELSSKLSSLETEEADILVKYSEINKQKLEIEARVSDIKAKISTAKQEIADWDVVIRTGTKLG